MATQAQSQVQGEGSCPVCHNLLPEGSDAGETHVATCIENQLLQLEDNMSKTTVAPSNTSTGARLFNVPDHVIDGSSSSPQPVLEEEHQCPVCHTPLLSKAIGSSESDREAHVAACLNALEIAKPPYVESTATDALALPHKNASSSSKFTQNQSFTPSPSFFSRAATPVLQTPESSSNATEKSGFLSIFGVKSKSKEEKFQDKLNKAGALMKQRWGPPGSPVYEMVMRYMQATHMTKYWEALGEQHPREFSRYLNKGYMEPIPTSWVQSRKLAWTYPEGSYWETPAEKRLYFLLNNGIPPDGFRQAQLVPLNIFRDRYAIISRGNERNARQVALDANKLAAYRSAGDVFHSDKQIHSHEYSFQVNNTVNEARQKALHDLADGILHGTDHLETMLLIDVSGSMTWNPHGGVIGPDGIRRYHDQPSNIRLVQHLVHRVLHHMIARAQKEHPGCSGIDTVTFSSYGRYIGQLSTNNFNRDWSSKVKLGGGTQVMQGWQAVKQAYFQHQNSAYGHGRLDPIYGWQPTPGMPKLSLLVFLDGEAIDMDEFELELLGETWAYVTIALVGMENCPHHHSHAIELERVARFNPHVGFFDVHGRVCERLVVEDLLGSVYPVDPPNYAEILKPEYDIPADELPAYSV